MKKTIKIIAVIAISFVLTLLVIAGGIGVPKIGRNMSLRISRRWFERILCPMDQKYERCSSPTGPNVSKWLSSGWIKWLLYKMGNFKKRAYSTKWKDLPQWLSSRWIKWLLHKMGNFKKIAYSCSTNVINTLLTWDRHLIIFFTG